VPASTFIRFCTEPLQQAESAESHAPKKRKTAFCWASALEQVGAGPSEHRAPSSASTATREISPGCHKSTLGTLLTSTSHK